MVKPYCENDKDFGIIDLADELTVISPLLAGCDARWMVVLFDRCINRESYGSIARTLDISPSQARVIFKKLQFFIKHNPRMRGRLQVL